MLPINRLQQNSNISIDLLQLKVCAFFGMKKSGRGRGGNSGNICAQRAVVLKFLHLINLVKKIPVLMSLVCVVPVRISGGAGVNRHHVTFICIRVISALTRGLPS